MEDVGLICYDVGVGCFKVRWNKKFGRALTCTPAISGTRVNVVPTEHGFEARFTDMPPHQYRITLLGCQPLVVCPQ